MGCQSNFEIDGDCRFSDDIYSLAPLLVGAVLLPVKGTATRSSEAFRRYVAVEMRAQNISLKPPFLHSGAQKYNQMRFVLDARRFNCPGEADTS